MIKPHLDAGLQVWTDGCCLRNPGGPGGWAAIVARSGRVLAECSGHERSSTNNRMELQAVIAGLIATAEANEPVLIFSDSRYVVDGGMRWMKGWKARGWTKKKGKIKNLELWQELDRRMEGRRVELEWVRGHTGQWLNEMADRLATRAAKKPHPDREPELSRKHCPNCGFELEPA